MLTSTGCASTSHRCRFQNRHQSQKTSSDESSGRKWVQPGDHSAELYWLLAGLGLAALRHVNKALKPKLCDNDNLSLGSTVADNMSVISCLRCVGYEHIGEPTTINPAPPVSSTDKEMCMYPWLLFACVKSTPPVLVPTTPILPAPNSPNYAVTEERVEAKDDLVAQTASRLNWDEALSGAAASLGLIEQENAVTIEDARWAAIRAGFPYHVSEVIVGDVLIDQFPRTCSAAR